MVVREDLSRFSYKDLYTPPNRPCDACPRSTGFVDSDLRKIDKVWPIPSLCRQRPVALDSHLSSGMQTVLSALLSIVPIGIKQPTTGDPYTINFILADS
jgi:hypothetical protein